MIVDPVKDGSDGVKTAEHFYIDPRSRFKLVWDVASLFCVLHSVIILPFALAFLRSNISARLYLLVYETKSYCTHTEKCCETCPYFDF